METIVFFAIIAAIEYAIYWFFDFGTIGKAVLISIFLLMLFAHFFGDRDGKIEKKNSVKKNYNSDDDFSNIAGFEIANKYICYKSEDANAKGIAVDKSGRVAIRADSIWKEIPIKEITNFELRILDNTSTQTSSNWRTGVAMGGLMGGPIGAIMGGINAPKTTINIREIKSVYLVLSIIDVSEPLRAIYFEKNIDLANEWIARLSAAKQLNTNER